MFSINFNVDLQRILEHWNDARPNMAAPADLVKQTKIFAQEVKNEWYRNEHAYVSKLAEVTGLNVEGNFTVYILPPVLEEAQYLNESEIEWGHSALFSNFISRGICHELLHCLTHEFYLALSDDEKWIFHALVYLSVDEEFYRHFHNTQEYFSSPAIESFYHPRLIETAKLLLPQWINFLKDKSTHTIYDVYNEIYSETTQ